MSASEETEPLAAALPKNGGEREGVLSKSDLAQDGSGESTNERKITKNKRFRRSPSKDDSFLKAALLRSKDRHQSRSGKGRGQPKKGGGGGKGTWGKPGSEYSAIAEDVADPNYDSDCQDGFVVQTSTPVLSDGELKTYLSDAFLEYFENGDSEDVICTISEFNVQPNQRPQALSILINLALDRKATQRELASILLSDLYGRLVGEEDYKLAFNSLFADLSDLTIDTPNAPEVIGQFLARAVADDCLPPKFVETSMENTGHPAEVQAALKKAHILLTIAHGIVRLDNVWGIGGGIRPVKALVKQIVLLLKEFLSSDDQAEAMRCLTELEVPHFHHELVYEAIVMVIESTKEETAYKMSGLLKHMAAVAVLTPDQIAQGFERVLGQMSDMLLDVPAAYTLLEEFANRCNQEGFLPTSVLKDLPAREGRKRYVSEGDGGLLKNGN